MLLQMVTPPGSRAVRSCHHRVETSIDREPGAGEVSSRRSAKNTGDGGETRVNKVGRGLLRGKRENRSGEGGGGQGREARRRWRRVNEVGAAGRKGRTNVLDVGGELLVDVSQPVERPPDPVVLMAGPGSTRLLNQVVERWINMGCFKRQG